MQLAKRLEHRVVGDEPSSAYPSSIKSLTKTTSCLESNFLCLFVLSHLRYTTRTRCPQEVSPLIGIGASLTLAS
ncbi:hypothetical protein PHMEG_00014855 [Phytophthora megakarya]|uniref:Uncharacterized protein n=1 Tax=Phytophthora megakarya TaxID=4795 RepID=A0A225W3A2_9STRA|nr:hypothetical protein PHMEG_00014855 [Phytophthora megakarya]